MTMKKTGQAQRQSVGGFTLVELAVSIALVSLLAVALGFAMFRTAERSARTKTLANQRQVLSELFRDLSEKMKWATDIVAVSPTDITFIHPQELSGNPVTTRYWKDNGDLKDKNGAKPIRVIAENIVDFILVTDEILEDGNTVIRAIDVTLQVGPDPQDTLQNHIALVNRPLKP